MAYKTFRYKIVREYHITDFIKAVEKLLNEEWTLVGGVAVTASPGGSNEFFQALQHCAENE